MQKEGALVLFSGGQDSTVCLAWALSRFRRVETIGFGYGQRHAIELEVRPRVREMVANLHSQWRERLDDDHVLDLDTLGRISETSLTRETAIAFGLKHLVAGMCETDFSGYPDCRDDTLKAMQVALSLGLDRRFVIDTPLMWIDKAATWELASELGGDALVKLIVEETHTCYLGERTRRHAWGVGCGTCPACALRAQGFAKWQERRGARA